MADMREALMGLPADRLLDIIFHKNDVIDSLRAQQHKYEEEEAALCPEDVGFPEFVRVLQRQLAAEKQRADTLESLILQSHGKALSANWVYTDSRTTLDLLVAEITTLRVELATEKECADALEAALNTPETVDFDKAVPLEAAHQIKRWGSEHDDGKQPEDWFWLLGYLAGKALACSKAGNIEKAKHHCISSAAALRNWHAHLRTGSTSMRPGIIEPDAARQTKEPEAK